MYCVFEWWNRSGFHPGSVKIKECYELVHRFRCSKTQYCSGAFTKIEWIRPRDLSKNRDKNLHKRLHSSDVVTFSISPVTRNLTVHCIDRLLFLVIGNIYKNDNLSPIDETKEKLFRSNVLALAHTHGQTLSSELKKKSVLFYSFNLLVIQNNLCT